MKSLGPYFDFGLVASRVFWCSQENQAFKITGEDRAAAVTAVDKEGPYWEFKCPACGGIHRFYPEKGRHIPPRRWKSK